MNNKPFWDRTLIPVIVIINLDVQFVVLLKAESIIVS